MRILLVSDHYPPFVGGVQRQTRRLAIELRDRGHEVGVATVAQDDLPRLESGDGFSVWRLPQLRTLPLVRGRPRRRHQPPGPDPISALALRRLINRYQPDLVHSSGWFSYAAALAMLGTTTPLVVSVREYGYICANASLLHKGAPCSGPQLSKCISCSSWYFGLPRGLAAVAGVWLSGPLLRRRATAVHSVSRYVNEIVTQNLFRTRPEIPQAIIPSFASAPEPDVDDELLARLPDEPFILFVGALRRVKGVDVLLSAYRELASPPPLVLLGTRERDSPDQLPPGAVALGPTSHGTVLAAWDRSLFGVMPSLWPEPFGSVVHEAMSCGRAVIGTTPGGHTDMIEPERTGLLSAPGDVGALRHAMQRLVDDPELRERLGRQAARRAQAFSADAIVPEFERIYARALAGA